jgi:hypothetical protein
METMRNHASAREQKRKNTLGADAQSSYWSYTIRQEFEQIQKTTGFKKFQESRTRNFMAEAYNLKTFMELSQYSKDSEPRDRIYALRGLIWDLEPEDIVVDYGRSLFKVKMDVVWYLNPKNNGPEYISENCGLVGRYLRDWDEDEQ